MLVPLSTLGNWMNEFDRFCPSIRTFRLHGTKEARVDAEETSTRIKPGVGCVDHNL